MSQCKCKSNEAVRRMKIQEGVMDMCTTAPAVGKKPSWKHCWFYLLCSLLHSGGQTTWADTWTQILHPQSCVNIWHRSRCSSPGEAPAMSPSCLHTYSFCREALVSRAATPLFTSQTCCQTQLIFLELDAVVLLHKPDLDSSLSSQNTIRALPF